MAHTHDMVVIGGGPGGYVSALKGRSLGLRVALIEKDKVGGVCLNEGCIPTKTLLADVEGVFWLRRAARDGIIDALPTVNFAAMSRRKKAVVDKMVSNLEKLLLDSGVDLIKGSASIPRAGQVVSDSGMELTTGHIVIATGSRAWVPPIPGSHLPGVITTTEILKLESVPKRLVIVGGGVIGQEFASMFAALGSQVTVLEALDRILVEVDGEIARRYGSLLAGRGIKTEVGVTIRGISQEGKILRVTYTKKDREKSLDGDLVLMATGRRPCFDELGINRLGIAVNRGAIMVDDGLMTSVPGIYAIGDVLGRKMLAHVASYQGELVSEIISGRAKRVMNEVVPSCIFTVPEIAWVGLTEEEAQSAGLRYRTSSFALAASGKAQAAGQPHGLVKLIENFETGRLVGAHFMGPHVSELVGELTLAIRTGMSAQDIVNTIHPHPTISESVHEAALGFLDGPLHAQSRVREVIE